VLDNYRAKLGHALAKPGWYTASVKREIGSAGTLHASILIANDHREKQNSTVADGANGGGGIVCGWSVTQAQSALAESEQK
jgi:hypothetical protein